MTKGGRIKKERMKKMESSKERKQKGQQKKRSEYKKCESKRTKTKNILITKRIKERMTKWENQKSDWRKERKRKIYQTVFPFRDISCSQSEQYSSEILV